MRIPKYLSHSSISLFYSDRTEFYLKYLAENRPPRLKQNRAMSIGSAFDAYVKSYLVERLFGPREQFNLDNIFTTQVESHNRDWAREHGKYAFECYKRSGALADLMIELSLADGEPRFEFSIDRTINDIPLTGKPDIWFVTKQGLHIILDWKVNGYCSPNAVSPTAGYIKCLDTWDGKPSRSHGRGHKDAHVMLVGGLQVNVAKYLEAIDQTWADQTTIYAWLMGASIGDKFIAGIDQLACAPSDPLPKIRVARHRGRVSEGYQKLLFDRIKNVWETIHSGHIFNDMTLEDSLLRQQTLDDYHKAYTSSDPKERWFVEITRGD